MSSKLVIPIFALIVLMLAIAVPASASVSYYTLPQSASSPEGVVLETFKVYGDNEEIYTGDKINAVYMLSYIDGEYDQLIVDNPIGISFLVTSPDGKTKSYGDNSIGKVINNGDFISNKDILVFDTPGVWKISPGFSFVTSPKRIKLISPSDWPAAEITVLKKEVPKPDLIAETASLGFDTASGKINTVSYTIKNIGEVDSSESVVKIIINGEDTGITGSVGFLPAGESATIFEKIDIPFKDAATSLEVIVNPDGAIEEESAENNVFTAIIDNPEVRRAESVSPVPSSKQDSEASVHTYTKQDAVAVVSADSCLAYSQNCNSIYTCTIIGTLSILLCIVTFALGYYYGISKSSRCEMILLKEELRKLNAARNDERSDSRDKSDKKQTEKSDINKELKEFSESGSDEKKQDAAKKDEPVSQTDSKSAVSSSSNEASPEKTDDTSVIDEIRTATDDTSFEAIKEETETK